MSKHRKTAPLSTHQYLAAGVTGSAMVGIGVLLVPRTGASKCLRPLRQPHIQLQRGLRARINADKDIVDHARLIAARRPTRRHAPGRRGTLDGDAMAATTAQARRRHDARRRNGGLGIGHDAQARPAASDAFGARAVEAAKAASSVTVALGAPAVSHSLRRGRPPAVKAVKAAAHCSAMRATAVSAAKRMPPRTAPRPPAVRAVPAVRRSSAQVVGAATAATRTATARRMLRAA